MKRPSEHDISDKFGRDNAGAIPPNLVISSADDGTGTVGEPVLVTDDFSYRPVDRDAPAEMEQPALSSSWLNEGFYDFVPVNVIAASNTSSNDRYLRQCRSHGIAPHPARFPKALPEFIIGLCTEEGDVVLDPFAGSNMTGFVAESMNRHWIALEQSAEYLTGAIFRFDGQILAIADELQSLRRDLNIDQEQQPPLLP